MRSGTMTRRILPTLVACISLGLAYGYLRAGEGQRVAATRPTSRATTTTAPAAAFKVRLPGSTAVVEMLPVPAGVLDVRRSDGRVEHKPIKAFYLAKTELTWDQWDPWYFFLDVPEAQRHRFPVADAQSRPSRQYEPMDHGFGHNGFPALNQHVNAAHMYCEWLSAKTGRKFRLPTEEEWEYAARAGGPAKELTEEELRRVAWFDKNSEERTHAVAQLKPNAWGFYDLLGNVGEWVVASDGTPLVAGGAFTDGVAKVQVTARAKFDKSWDRSDDMDPPSRWWLYDAPFAGVRVVCDP